MQNFCQNVHLFKMWGQTLLIGENATTALLRKTREQKLVKVISHN